MNRNDDVKNRLFDILSETGSQYEVFNNRLALVPISNCPYILIRDGDEVLTDTEDRKGYIRNPTFEIVCVAKGIDSVADLETGELTVNEQRNEIITFVEEKLNKQAITEAGLNEIVHPFRLKNISRDQDTENHEEYVAMAVMTYEGHFLDEIE